MKQLDLFLDGRSVRLRNALRQALMDEDADEAEIAYLKLANFDAAHRWLPPARKLIAALRSPRPSCAEEGLAVQTRLESEWTQAAHALLGEDGRDLLHGIWHHIGDALSDTPFDPCHPERHASHAFGKCGDWSSVQRCIRAMQDFSTHPVLLARIAQASWRQRRWKEAAGHWFELCWIAPERFQALMDRGEIPDPVLREGWQRAQDQDLEPAISPPWFPAWMLIHKPKIAKLIPAPPVNGSPQAAFAVLRELTIDDSEDVDLRRRLQQLHSGLLACFLSQR